MHINNHNEFFHASLNAGSLPKVLDESLLNWVRDNLNLRRSFGVSPSAADLKTANSRSNLHKVQENYN